MLTHLVDRYNPRVVERGNRLGLVLESPQLGVVRQNARPDHLQRHRPVQAHLHRIVDHTHAAPA